MGLPTPWALQTCPTCQAEAGDRCKAHPRVEPVHAARVLASVEAGAIPGYFGPVGNPLDPEHSAYTRALIREALGDDGYVSFCLGLAVWARDSWDEPGVADFYEAEAARVESGEGGAEWPGVSSETVDEQAVADHATVLSAPVAMAGVVEDRQQGGTVFECDLPVVEVASLTEAQARAVLKVASEDPTDPQMHLLREVMRPGDEWDVDPDWLVKGYLVYPLSAPVEFNLAAPRLTLGLIVWAIAKTYQTIYAQEAEDIAAGRPGRWGIWGHSINDLVIEGFRVSPSGVVYASIGS